MTNSTMAERIAAARRETLESYRASARRAEPNQGPVISVEDHSGVYRGLDMTAFVNGAMQIARVRVGRTKP